MEWRRPVCLIIEQKKEDLFRDDGHSTNPPHYSTIWVSYWQCEGDTVFLHHPVNWTCIAKRIC
jgi:hypothetical protein